MKNLSLKLFICYLALLPFLQLGLAFQMNQISQMSPGVYYSQNLWQSTVFAAENTPQTVKFVYDGDGNRVAKIERGKTTVYVGDSEKNILTGDVTRYYSFGSKKIALKDNSGINYIVSDHLGSVQSLSDKNGTSTTQLTYYPYGQVRSQTGIVSSRQYTGQINDTSTGLYFYNARYYNPQTANFIQADVAGDGLNKYIYVKGNPINYTDPTGNEGEEATNSDNDCTTNPLSPSCIMLTPSNTYTPIQASQPLTLQACYSQEECQVNQEFGIALFAFLGLTVGGGAVAGVATPALIEQATALYITVSNLWNRIMSGDMYKTYIQQVESGQVYDSYVSEVGPKSQQFIQEAGQAVKLAGEPIGKLQQIMKVFKYATDVGKNQAAWGDLGYTSPNLDAAISCQWGGCYELAEIASRVGTEGGLAIKPITLFTTTYGGHVVSLITQAGKSLILDPSRSTKTLFTIEEYFQKYVTGISPP